MRGCLSDSFNGKPKLFVDKNIAKTVLAVYFIVILRHKTLFIFIR